MDVVKTPEYWNYLHQARNAPRSTDETRVALVSQQLGLSAADLEPFYYTNRKGSKKRYFDHKAFAEKFDINVHWLWEGSLREYPRHLKPPVRRTNGSARKQRRSKNGTPEERAARYAAAAARVASVGEDSGWTGATRRLSPAAQTTWINIFQRLRMYVVKEFGRGKDIDQIFDQLIAEAPADFR